MIKSEPSGKEENTLHKIQHFSFQLIMKIGFSGHGNILYNSDCHKEEDFHTSYHRKTVFYPSKPSEMKMRILYLKIWKILAKQLLFSILKDEKVKLTILSAPMCSPTHDLQISSGQGGHGEPGVTSLWWFDFFFFVFNVNSGLGGGLGPWHLEYKIGNKK